jgi:signal peptidase I
LLGRSQASDLLFQEQMEIKSDKIVTDNNHNLFFFDATGFSMWPFVKQGEKLIVKKAPMQDLMIGDIILYRKDKQLVCHRLVRKIIDNEEYCLYARGDNTKFLLEPITEQMFFGKAVGKIKNGRIISLTGRRQQIINRFIIMVSPLINIGVKTGKALLRK